MISDREPPSMARAGRRDLSHLPISLYQFCKSVEQCAQWATWLGLLYRSQPLDCCVIHTLTRLDGQQMMTLWMAGRPKTINEGSSAKTSGQS